MKKTHLFRLLDLGSELVDEVCKSPTKENTRKLELITKMTQDEINKQKICISDKRFID